MTRGPPTLSAKTPAGTCTGILVPHCNALRRHDVRGPDLPKNVACQDRALQLPNLYAAELELILCSIQMSALLTRRSYMQCRLSTT